MKIMKKLTALILTLCICLSLAITASANETPKTNKTSDTLYGTGSIGKVFCAAAAMKLVDDGLLDLDEPIITYIPEFEMADLRYTQITAKMLLNHSAGFMGSSFRNGMLLGDGDNSYYHDNIPDYLKTQTLKHDPGDRSIYCNDGFTMAEILIERISGMSYTEFLEENFFKPLGVNIYTRESDFDREKLAGIYMGNNELKYEVGGAIGAGGLYSTMEDTCKYATIFMNNSDNSLLSKQSVEEMAKKWHRNSIVPANSDTICSYGLGWDSVDAYPFNQLGIKALSKGGDTNKYHSNLTVLPEYNLAVSVGSSGSDSLAHLIAQEIILAVLIEEGLIPANYEITIPEQNTEPAAVPESVKANAGFYDAGMMGIYTVSFTDTSLILTPFAVRNELPMEFIYNADGEFISTNGESFGLMGIGKGITVLSFDRGYLIMKTYEDVQGLSVQAIAWPLAQRIEANNIGAEAINSWSKRNNREYLLVSEKYSSVYYINQSVAKIQTDERLPGYVGPGILRSRNGRIMNWAKITADNTALGYQDTPTMLGRDTNNLYITEQNGIEYLNINAFKYIDASSCKKLSEAGTNVVVDTETIWFDIDESLSGKVISIKSPQNSSWHIYNDKMDCVTTSLEKNPGNAVILPDNGRIAFCGNAGISFVIKFMQI